MGLRQTGAALNPLYGLIARLKCDAVMMSICVDDVLFIDTDGHMTIPVNQIASAATLKRIFR